MSSVSSTRFHLASMRSYWQQAFDDGVAPPVVLAACHERALELLRLKDLEANAAG